MLSMKLSFFAGVIVAFPLLLMFILQFILPGLHANATLNESYQRNGEPGGFMYWLTHDAQANAAATSARLLQPTAGSRLWNGHAISGLAPAGRRAAG